MDYENILLFLPAMAICFPTYGKALSMAGKHQKAIEVLQQATTYYPNTIVYTVLVDSYKETSQIKMTESSYLQSWHLNPSHFYAKYLFAKNYNKTSQTEKAVFTITHLLLKYVKIKFSAVEKIFTEMLKIIRKTSIDDNNLLQNTLYKQPKPKRAYHSKVLIMGFKLQMW